MTETSTFPIGLRAAGRDFGLTCRDLAAQAYRRRQRLNRSTASVHRYMFGAVVAERRAVPVLPSLVQHQASPSASTSISFGQQYRMLPGNRRGGWPSTSTTS